MQGVQKFLSTENIIKKPGSHEIALFPGFLASLLIIFRPFFYT
jgi:hypothetical protein